jgi:hypothetical protein
LGARTGTTQSASGPWLWPLVLVIAGFLLLLDNFLLLGDFNAAALLPLLLVIAGAQILLRGDLVPSAEARRFGITRGSVESATLEISSGEIDMDVRALQEDWTLQNGQPALIAGQFAADTRPQLRMKDNYAHLRLDRAATPWLSMADWKIGVARDLPWQIIASAYLGQISLDLSGLIVHDVIAATGLSEIRFVCPREALGTIALRSSVGNIHVLTPPGCHARIEVRPARLFTVHADPRRYENPELGLFIARDPNEDAPIVTIQVSGTFGDAYLA